MRERSGRLHPPGVTGLPGPRRPVMSSLALLGLLLTGCAAPAPAGAGSSAASPAVSSSRVSSAAPSLSSMASTATASASLSASATPPPTTAVRPAVPSSPVLYPQVDGGLTAQPAPPGSQVPLNPADGQTRDGDPYRPLVFDADNLWLTPTGGISSFRLAVDAGTGVGSAVQVRVSYDLTGDGGWDRVETYRYFATDPLDGAEVYTDAAGLQSGFGSLGELVAGTVRLEIWSALGDGPVTVDLAETALVLPFS